MEAFLEKFTGVIVGFILILIGVSVVLMREGALLPATILICGLGVVGIGLSIYDWIRHSDDKKHRNQSLLLIFLLVISIVRIVSRMI